MNNAKKIDHVTDSMISIVPFALSKLIHKHGKKIQIGPSKSQYQILFILSHHGTMPTTDICEHLNISKPNMTVLVDRLISEGFVIRINDEKDRRVINLCITKKGRQFIKKQVNIVKSVMKKNLSQLGDDDITLLDKSLDAIKNVFAKIDNKN